MPNTHTNGSETGKMHVVVESALKAFEKTREDGNALRRDEEVHKIRKELDEMKKQQAETITRFEIQQARSDLWNKIEAILVPLLSAAVFGLASWVWQSEGKIGNAELRITGLQTQVESMEARTRNGTTDRYTRTQAEGDHEAMKEDMKDMKADMYKLLEGYKKN